VPSSLARANRTRKPNLTFTLTRCASFPDSNAPESLLFARAEWRSSMILSLLASALLLAMLAPTALANDGLVLKAQILKSYPSLLYVERFRHSFPDEAQGARPFWSLNEPAPNITRAEDLVRTLAELEDQHVALVGPRAGKPETLGVLFRTSTDGATIVWRVLDSSDRVVRTGDDVLAIDGVPTRRWLRRTAALTFGGNRRGRYAEAATELGLATPIVHRSAGLGDAVRLLIRSSGGAARTVTVPYRPMNAHRARALARAIDRSDLAAVIESDGYRIGTLRIGAFAPQYDPAFEAASNLASRKPGVTDDQAMLAGYCAVTASFIKRFEAIARRSDAVVVDLRGNLGGFDREARLEANAIAPASVARTFDLFATGKRGTVRLAEEQVDPSCGHVAFRRPIVVLVDAATRSAGELMATWLWTSGSAVVGERTVGAGGGFEFNADGFLLPKSGFRVRTSGNFTVFDPAVSLNEGDWPERDLIAKITASGFAPSRSRPFSIQAVGIRPDVTISTTSADLRDGGVAEVKLAIRKLRSQHRLRQHS